MQQQCRVQEQYTQYRKKIRNIYSVPDKKKTWKRYVLTGEKPEDTGAGVGKDPQKFVASVGCSKSSVKTFSQAGIWYAVSVRKLYGSCY